MAVGDIISRVRFNEIRGKIANVLGPGSGDKGYNQGLSSRVVPSGDDVLAADMNNLYDDMVKIYVHQNGVPPTTIFEVTTVDQITDALFADFESLINAAEGTPQRFAIDSTQAALESAGVNSTRSDLWGGSSTPQAVVHEVKVTFSSATMRRAFFNAGGEIRFQFALSHSLVGGDPNYAKTVDWKNMLGAIGTVRFTYNSTSATTGAGTPSLKGNYQLTSSYQQLYLKTGSGVYADNDVTIQARNLSDNAIAFKITFQDDANGAGGADERVDGTLTSSITQYRPDGNFVDIPASNLAWSYIGQLSSLQSNSVIDGSDTVPCIAVIDEAGSQRSAGMATKWNSFRIHWPGRPFWLLQPGGPSEGNLYESDAFIADANANLVSVNRDEGIVSELSDWFDIAGLSSLTPGEKVALSIDGSGSMTKATVQASYNLFVSKCAAAGLEIVELGMSNEDWILPFDIIIS